ncbi:hypothetical protein JXR93_09395, partial [bacterium]|nr:hypothetical protein [bacterium]
TVSGTFGFMAPEVFKGDISPKSDYYSVGVLAVVLLSRKNPEEMIENSFELSWRKYIGKISEKTGRFIEKLIDNNPENRIETPQSGIKAIHDALNCLNQNKLYNSTSKIIEKSEENQKNFIKSEENQKNSEHKSYILEYNRADNPDFEKEFYDLYSKLEEYMKNSKNISPNNGVFNFLFIIATIIIGISILSSDLYPLMILYIIGVVIIYFAKNSSDLEKRYLQYISQFFQDINYNKSENRELILAVVKLFLKNETIENKNFESVFEISFNSLLKKEKIDKSLLELIENQFLATETGKKFMLE